MTNQMTCDVQLPNVHVMNRAVDSSLVTVLSLDQAWAVERRHRQCFGPIWHHLTDWQHVYRAAPHLTFMMQPVLRMAK